MTQQQPLQKEALVNEGAFADVFGYPLVLMDVTRQVMTAVPKVDDKRLKAPVNQFAHVREFPDASFRDVRSPNADTLYSLAFLDLKAEPMILSVPGTGERYYLMQLCDAWTNVFAAPGTRTTGNGKRSFAITGPSWTGTLPRGVDEIRSPTNMVWVIGRTQTNGKADYPAVHAVQDQYKVTPLSAWGKDYEPPEQLPVPPGVDMATTPVEQVAKMDATTFFNRLNLLMKDNPPSAADAEAMKRLAKLGIEPGKAFGPGRVDPAVLESAEQGADEGLRQITAEMKKRRGQIINGWQVMFDVGRYGTDYLWRGTVAMIGIGANLPEDAVYPRAITDRTGEPLTGTSRYLIHFPKGALPPVGAFWSITMYDDEQFFVDNPIDRYAIGDQDALHFNVDGSLTLYVESDSPGKDKESNWLPAARGSFNLLMRLYHPKEEILQCKWQIPPVQRIG
jgi:hypothetical protein